MVIGISGGSGSGKTTFAQKLLRVIGAERATLLSQDYYYIDQSEAFHRDPHSVNFDHPQALEFSLMAAHLRELKAGNKVKCPQYDFVTHTRKDITLELEPRPVIVVEGILVFHPPELFKELDISFFMEAPEDLRLQRRIDRDKKERGRSPEETRDQFLRQVKPMHDQFIEATKTLATYVVKTY